MIDDNKKDNELNNNTDNFQTNYENKSEQSYQSQYNGFNQQAYGNYVNTNTYKNTNESFSKKTISLILIICIIGSALLGFGGGMLAYNMSLKNKSSSGGVNVITSENSSASDPTVFSEATSTENVVNAAANSIVEITTESVKKGSFMQQYVIQGAGSGVIVSQDGHIITNNHVIEGASKITVTLKNGQNYVASLIGTDSDTDIALIKVDVNDLTPVVFGDSSKLQVGQKAIAIGNPLGELGGTVTEGIISALDRNINLNGVNMTLLQTDASINPGNSGGGLFNTKGEFIGLVVAKSSGEDVEGLGFAIPANNVTPIIEQLSAHGYVTGKALLGVSLVDVTSNQAAAMYRVSQLGVYIAQITEGTGAANSDLKVGDCIISIDDQKVSTSSEVQQIVKSHSAGDNVNIKVLRNNEQVDVNVTLSENVPTTNNNASSQQSLFNNFGF